MCAAQLQTFRVSNQEPILNGKQNSNYGSKTDGTTHVWVPVNGESRKPHVVGSVKSVVDKGSTLTFHSICYKVKVKTKACCGRTEDKEILKSIE